MDDQLQQAIELIKAGKKADGRRILIGVVRSNPNNERAWGMLYSVAENNSEKISYLTQVLRINPNNDKARKVLADIGQSEEKIGVDGGNGTDISDKLEDIIDQLSMIRSDISGNKTSGTVSLFTWSIAFGNLVATWWVWSYLANTVIGQYATFPLTDYVFGERYGLSLGGVELLFVVVCRYMIGFGLSSSSFYFVTQATRLLLTAIKKPS